MLYNFCPRVGADVFATIYKLEGALILTSIDIPEQYQLKSQKYSQTLVLEKKHIERSMCLKTVIAMKCDVPHTFGRAEQQDSPTLFLKTWSFFATIYKLEDAQ